MGERQDGFKRGQVPPGLVAHVDTQTLVTRLRKTMGVFPIASVTSSRILLDFAGAAAEVSCFTGAATAWTRRAVRDRAPTPTYGRIQEIVLSHSLGCSSADALATVALPCCGRAGELAWRSLRINRVLLTFSL